MGNGSWSTSFEFQFFVQHPRRECDFGGSLRDEEVIDSSIDDDMSVKKIPKISNLKN